MALTLDSVKNIPNQYKFLILLGVMVGIGAGYYFGIYTGKKEELRKNLEALNKSKTELQKLQDTKKNMDAYKAKVAELEAELNLLLVAIPTSSEIPEILSQIDSKGNEAGLEFLLFQPVGETQVGDYYEVPVSIRVKGTYHGFATFLDKLRQLDRIINVRNVKMTRGTVVDNEIILDITCRVVTFRF
ncbi:MAG: type 4a pilus biogenesis protein PilO [Deltaproteobacteria bacterium]|nr:type 4a pilus biogenesis protein PilO [Candidatus Zymogenaceae bacterium]